MIDQLRNAQMSRIFLTLRLLLLFTFLSATACSSFRGPGEFRAGNAAPAESEAPQTVSYPNPEEGDEDAMPSPDLTWRGERRITKKSTEIQFDWPVREARLTQPFRLGPKRAHWGIDLANKKGTPILAAESGYVIYTGRGFRGYGNLIVIEHSPEWATLYSHLDKIQVKEGAYVQRGQQIGTMGRTGRASGVHLHFEMRHNRQPVNPQAYLPPGF